jgi:Methyltransferase domain
VRHRTHIRYLTGRACLVHVVDLSPGMIALAQHDHAGIATQVVEITDLPGPDARFDGVLYWSSIIHVADSDLGDISRSTSSAATNGVVLVAFQTGEGACDVAAGYRKLGDDVTLTRFPPHGRPGVAHARRSRLRRRAAARTSASPRK